MENNVEYCECEWCGRLVICREIDGQMLCDRCFAAKIIEERPSKSCSYYAENDKKPCCTHDCDVCMWYV